VGSAGQLSRGDSLVDAGEKWPYGEWKHGGDGMLEFFTETGGRRH
jgi:hypothetical protein